MNTKDKKEKRNLEMQFMKDKNKAELRIKEVHRF